MSAIFQRRTHPDEVLLLRNDFETSYGEMRICLLGDISGNSDEGMKNVSRHLCHELSKRHEVLSVAPRAVFSRSELKRVREFGPEIIHYVHGPSVKSFIVVRFLARHCKNTRTVMSATRPELSVLSKRVIPFLRPDLMLVQSYGSEGMFRKLGCKTKFLPNGVDVRKFAPISRDQKIKLRLKYGIDQEKYIILHIGGIKANRNLGILSELQQGNNQVIVIGSTSQPLENNVYRNLAKSGCIVWRKYFENINEIYEISDCYVFPVANRIDGKEIPTSKLGCIDLPLTVMEAMACNLPVITTRFGALPRMFTEGDGFFFAEVDRDISQRLDAIKNGVKINTREKVLAYSWAKIVEALEGIYGNLLKESLSLRE